MNLAGWLLLLALVAALIGVGAAIGWQEAQERMAGREAQVRAEMNALMRAQRLNTAFLTARQALWAEARRHQRTPGR